MRYFQPYAEVDIDAEYVNGNPAIGLRGSIPPAAMVEEPMREIANLIENSGLVPSQDDVAQLLLSVRSQRVNYCVDVGSVNALQVICVPAVTALLAGFPLRVLVAFDNTGEASIRINGLGPVFILRANGASLDAGDLLAGEVVELVYDGSFFQIANYLGYSAEVENNYFYNFNIPYVQDTGSVNAMVGVFNPVITTLAAGLVIEVKAANAITGPCTMKCNDLAPVAVKSASLQQLVSGQIVSGQVALMVYDGVQFQLANPAIVTQVSLTGVQILKTAFYQDPNYHAFPLGRGFVEGFRTSYVPVSVGNKVAIQVNGTLTGDADVQPPETTGYEYSMRCSYSTDAGQTWYTSGQQQFGTLGTGPFIAGGFMSNVPYFHCQSMGGGTHTGGANIHKADFMFNIVGEMTVPEGPPTIIFRVEVWTDRPAILHGGSTMSITEFSA